MKRETSPHAVYIEDISKDIFDIITIYDMDLANEVLELKTNLTRPPVTVFDTEEKQVCLISSKAQLPGRLAELCFSQGKVTFLLCQIL